MHSFISPIAFPNHIANQYHESVNLQEIQGINSYKYFLIKKQSPKCLIFCHGNCMTVNPKTIDILRKYADLLNINVYMLEYPGYGECANSGYTDANMCYNALSILVNHVSKSYYSDDIFLFGHSIGTGVVTQYIYRNKNINFGGLILMSPFKSILNVVVDNEFINCSSSSIDFYKSKNMISYIIIPIMILHGTHDIDIDISHSEYLKHQNPKINFYKINTNHNEILNLNQFIEHIRDFITK